jgi:hypothetical protein
MHPALHTLFHFASIIAILALPAAPYGIAPDRLAHGPTRERCDDASLPAAA